MCSNELTVENIKNDMSSEAFRAAYALNMCTVSVSQIVDYQDINILEQEYEVILNNLNLELMPKDQALLDILKQLLDTITFFRISEGDKKMIEKEYKHKMKNAIWASAPNLGMIFTGSISPSIKTNLISIGASLATQVGIGYMNYRKNKSVYELEKDKEYWKLRRTAIEQFNSLRRELFTTAWRLAEAHNYPENYRLTENQIKQYNAILTDYDALRRFERLFYIKKYFYAYPPFWYFLGHAANEIVFDEQFSSETRGYYREQAMLCFDTYCNFNKINILRQDQLMASCALEYIELLDPKTDEFKIHELLNLAKNSAVTSEDVLQICAFSYLKINEYGSAAESFQFLVNENYNTILNAQILSQIYVFGYIDKMNQDIKRKYEILSTRVNAKYLFPFPVSREENIEDLANNFFQEQKAILMVGFERLNRLLFQKVVMQLNKILPCPELEFMGINYYSNQEDALNRRRTYMQSYLAFPNKMSSVYRDKIQNMELQYSIIQDLNDLLDTIKGMRAIYDIGDIKRVLSGANAVLAENADLINRMQADAKESRLTYENYEWAEKFFDEIVRNIFRYVLFYGKKRIAACNSMAEIVQIEECLLNTCERTKISTDILAADDFSSSLVEIDQVEQCRFTMAIFGSEAVVNQSLVDSRIAVVEAIKNNLDGLFICPTEKSKNKPHIYINGTNAFDEYVARDKGCAFYEGAKSKIAAFIVDEYSHFDIILTGLGIFIRQLKSFGRLDVSSLVPYEKIDLLDGDTLLLDGHEYKNPILNMGVFIQAVKQINAKK